MGLESEERETGITYLTQQEAFDRMVRGLAAQGWQQASQGWDSACRYRTYSGLKCAIGQLIPDEKYDVEMEGRSPYVVLRQAGFEVVPRFGSFLDRCQSEHDGPYTPFEIYTRFRKLAQMFGLDFPIDCLPPGAA
jgi:hypothetical protein